MPIMASMRETDKPVWRRLPPSRSLRYQTQSVESSLPPPRVCTSNKLESGARAGI